MDREKFLNLLNNDIDLFISNYLIDGNLDGLSGVDDVSVYITDCFPYLSTFYLILSNFDSIESKKFIERHGSKLEEETNILKARLGHLLYHKNEFNLIKQKLEDSEKENEAKRILIHLLNDDISTLKTDNRLQEQKILELQDENNELVRKISELELRLKEVSHSSVLDDNKQDGDNKGGISSITSEVISATHRTIESVVRSVSESTSKSIKDSSLPRTWANLVSSVSTHKIKYPDKSKINQSNIFNIIIKDCIPYGKYVFEEDLVRDIDLDLNKLNQILKENYSLQPILFGSIASKRLKDLKALILSKLSR